MTKKRKFVCVLFVAFVAATAIAFLTGFMSIKKVSVLAKDENGKRRLVSRR